MNFQPQNICSAEIKPTTGPLPGPAAGLSTGRKQDRDTTAKGGPVSQLQAASVFRNLRMH